MSITQLASDADDKTKQTFIDELKSECKKVRDSGVLIDPALTPS